MCDGSGSLSPPLREALYHQAGRGWRNNDDCISSAIVALLPRPVREAEGRRHLALPALATRPAARLPYAALLPWDEARAVLEPFIANPDAGLRATAISALVAAARYHRDRLPELLAFLRARKNEQDPVRLAMLQGIASLPPGRWQAEHLADLAQILRDALNAADLSPATAREAERLIIQLVPFHPAWCANWLATLVQERGQMSFFNLGARLADRDIARIAPSLLPVLHSWETREREQHIVAAASSLRRRLKVFDEPGGYPGAHRAAIGLRHARLTNTGDDC